MKKALIYLCKAALSGLIALAVLSVFCFFYDNAPVIEEQPLEFTNYRFAPDSFWSYMTEGFGFGRTDNIGYNNAQDLSGYSDPVVAFLGSSHTEAFQVPQTKNYVSLTQAKLLEDHDAGNDYQCVNLGASAHFFNVTASNFDYFTDCFDDVRYAVIEAHHLEYSAEDLQRMLSGAYHDPLKKGRFSRLLDDIPVLRLPFLRTLKKQIDRVDREADVLYQEAAHTTDYAAYEASLDRLLAKISSSAEKSGFEVIVLYHHSLELSDREGLARTDDPALIQIFKETSERHSIHFIDITDDFVAHYRLTHETPYGFMNTAMGMGHLNTVGHRIISDAIYQRICELEKVK